MKIRWTFLLIKCSNIDLAVKMSEWVFFMCLQIYALQFE